MLKFGNASRYRHRQILLLLTIRADSNFGHDTCPLLIRTSRFTKMPVVAVETSRRLSWYGVLPLAFTVPLISADRIIVRARGLFKCPTAIIHINWLHDAQFGCECGRSL